MFVRANTEKKLYSPFWKGPDNFEMVISDQND